MARNRGNRPLMIYTSLIFVVAVLMVIVAFFGQRHLNNVQLRQTETARSISERASQVSEENRLLMDVYKNLSEECKDLNDQVSSLTEETERLTKEAEAWKKLNAAFEALNTSGKSKARKLLSEIYTEDLTPEQKKMYDTLYKKCN